MLAEVRFCTSNPLQTPQLRETRILGCLLFLVIYPLENVRVVNSSIIFGKGKRKKLACI